MAAVSVKRSIRCIKCIWHAFVYIVYLPLRECPLLETFSSLSKCFLALRMLICVAADAVEKKSILLYFCIIDRVQRKSLLQLVIRASWSQHLLALTSFQLAPKTLWPAELISQFFCYSNSSKNITCPSGKLKTEFTSPIAKSTSPGLSDTTFFAHR